MVPAPWNHLRIPRGDLQLKATLIGGQSFRWRRAAPGLVKDEEIDVDNLWIGVMANCVWLLTQDEKYLRYKVLGEMERNSKDPFAQVRFKVEGPKKVSAKKKNGLLYNATYYDSLLKAYFRLDTDLRTCYDKWSQSHAHFKNEAGQFYAVRVLDQDPVENLFSFICSQNNHISRISSLVEKLCTFYGPKICDIDDIPYYAFPDFADLSKPEVEGKLRKESFGYRAKFIQKSAFEIAAKGGLEWFSKMQDMDYKSAHTELVSLTGIGPKVADCICLMSLNHLQAIPVDTHVFKIAVDNYLPLLRNVKSITPKIYTEIGDTFRTVYGPLAGWAQTVLFCADLKRFKESSDHSIGDASKPKKRRK